MAQQSNGDDLEISGINVTPLVDIMLVLLIIFLVTATYIVKEAIKIELPRAASSTEPISRTFAFLISKEGRVYLDGAPVDDAAILGKLSAIHSPKSDIQALIGADRDARHGVVVHLLDLLKGQGVTKFAIEVEKEAAAGRPAP
jgi:biopolymer transport protein ExbD